MKAPPCPVCECLAVETELLGAMIVGWALGRGNAESLVALMCDSHRAPCVTEMLRVAAALAERATAEGEK